jgi:hypothetical protein
VHALPRGRFEVVARRRPVAVTGVVDVARQYDGASSDRAPTPRPAPYAAVEVDLRPEESAAVDLELAGADGTLLRAGLAGLADGGRVTLSVSQGPPAPHDVRRSRRHGRTERPPDRFALTLTGAQLTALTHEGGRWVARGRVDLRDSVDPRDPAWLDGLMSGWSATGSDRAVEGWRAGGFGQLGLRDLRVVSHADGTPYRTGDGVLLTATSAGPGFFDTAHTSVWTLDESTLELTHRSDLYFERPDRPGVYGDHATHLLRDGDRWLAVTSTWGDFDRRSRHGKPYVDVTRAESADDLTTGAHRLATEPQPLPTDGLRSVGVWDPHLAHDGDEWLVGFVSARRYFHFHPALAAGPDLDRLTLRGAATGRRATEGTTLVRSGGDWRVLASDGRDSRRGTRRRYPVFDTDLRETGALDAPYPSNLPWPTVVPQPDGSWLLVAFDGTPYGGELPGYGTHGDVVVMRATAD